MAKTPVYFELTETHDGSAVGYTVPAGKHLIVTNHRAALNSSNTPQGIRVNGGEPRLDTRHYGRLTGAVLPSGTTLAAVSSNTDIKQSISGYLVDN